MNKAIVFCSNNYFLICQEEDSPAVVVGVEMATTTLVQENNQIHFLTLRPRVKQKTY